MSCLAFAAALKEPDNDASNLNLHKLITAGTFTGDTLSSVAKDYLRAFGNATLSYIRRRWIGIALTGMLNASPRVLDHINIVQLQSLGNVILSSTEREETKIVAGLIVRQALELDVDFASFWTSDKIRNSAPNFPKDSGAQWLISFQSFLDTLGDLALANPITDPSILYPVAVVGSDSFHWASSDKGLPIAIVQQDSLTIILPDDSLKDIQFLDVPIAHIHSTESRPAAPLYDSQSQPRGTTHAPWDLIVTFKPSAGTYSLNNNKRRASEITVLFGRSDDAQECELSINELLKSSMAKPSASHQSTTTNPRSSSPYVNKGTKQQRIVFRSSSIDISRRLPRRQNGETEQSSSSSDPLGKTPAARSHSTHQSTDPKPYSKPSQASDHVHSAGRQGLASAEQMAEQEQQLPEAENIRTRTRQSQKRLAEARDQTQSDSKKTLSSPADSPTITTSGEGTQPTQDKSKKQSQSNGKLQKVSLATKQRVAGKLREESDIFEIPDETTPKPTRRKRKSSNNASDPVSGARTKDTKAGASSQSQRSSNRAKTTRSKRRAEEDDDFVPIKKPAKKSATKRKPVAEAVDARKNPKKKAKVEHKASTPHGGLGASSSHVEAYHVDVEFDERLPEVMSQRQKAKDAGNSQLPAALPHNSLIGGLLGFPKPTSTTKASFKKPAIPSRPAHHPSTPTHNRSVPFMPTSRPETPGAAQRTPNTFATMMSSSPPGNDLTLGDQSGVQHDAAEAEILSSNSKPVPASPNAESTAISGHADRDDVDMEKKRSEVQIARRDPFQQRRESRKPTSFTRRLTGDGQVGGKMGLSASASEPEIIVSSDTEDSLVKSQPLPQGHPAAGRITNHRRFAVQPSQPKRKAIEDLQSVRGVPEKRSQLAVADRSDVRDGPPPVVVREATPIADQSNAATQIEDSVLSAPQQLVDDTQNEQVEAEAQNGPDEDGDTTLVNDEEESDDPLPTRKDTSPTFYRSSPPGTPSSHSSTSAEPETSPRTPMPTSEAEAEQWEATLQPHQRALHDQLIRVSKRVLRHVVDSETAVTDIADVFASDGEHLLNGILQRQHSDYNELRVEMALKKKALKKELENAVKALAKERQRVAALE